MGGINIAGVMKGGLAAALIMNISQYLLLHDRRELTPRTPIARTV